MIIVPDDEVDAFLKDDLCADLIHAYQIMDSMEGITKEDMEKIDSLIRLIVPPEQDPIHYFPLRDLGAFVKKSMIK